MAVTKEDLLYHIHNWMTTRRADLLDANIRRTPAVENAAYDTVVSRLIEDEMLSFKTEEDILNADPGTIGDHFDRVLNEEYGRSIYRIVDRVWQEEFNQNYRVLQHLAILTGEIDSIVRVLRDKGITIESVVEELPTGLSEMEANDEGKIYLTEEQLEFLVRQEIYTTHIA